jgi:hypothetical protein
MDGCRLDSHPQKPLALGGGQATSAPKGGTRPPLATIFLFYFLKNNNFLSFIYLYFNIFTYIFFWV